MNKPAKSQCDTAIALETMPRLLKMSEVAEYFAISVDLVAQYRDAAELEFINVGAPGAKNPSWRITRESVARFENRRQATKKK
jgi:hypothetical protein